LSWFAQPEAIADEILSLGRLHTDLDEREIAHAADPTVKRALQAAAGDKLSWNGQEVDPRYRFRRQTLYDWLHGLITPDLLPQLRAIIPDDEARRRKAERDAAREKTRDRVKEGRYDARNTGEGVRSSNEQKRATARLLRAAGKSYREIAAELGVSHETVRLWCA
jgi:hypothetical protein